MLTSDRITPRPAANALPAETSQPSRIEDIGARLALLHRQHNELDDLMVDLMPGIARNEDAESKSAYAHADRAKSQICDDMEILTQALSIERPRTAKEFLICVLHMISPAQEAIRAIPEDAHNEKFDGEAAYRMLRGMVPGLEALAGVTRADLGCIGYYFEDIGAADADENDALISKLQKLVSKQEAASC